MSLLTYWVYRQPAEPDPAESEQQQHQGYSNSIIRLSPTADILIRLFTYIFRVAGVHLRPAESGGADPVQQPADPAAGGAVQNGPAVDAGAEVCILYIVC